MKVGIINVTGYAGAELTRILYQHPEVEITSVTGRSAAGQKLAEVFPHLSALDLTITPALEGSLDLVFSALLLQLRMPVTRPNAGVAGTPVSG